MDRYSTKTLIDSIRDYSEYVRIDYERDCLADAEQNAKVLLDCAMELWKRMVEMRGEGES